MNLTLHDLQDSVKLHTIKSFLDPFPCLYGIKGVNSRFFVGNETMAKWIGYGTGYHVMEKMPNTEEFNCKTADLANIVYQEDNTVIAARKPFQFLGFTEFADKKSYLLFGTKTPIIDAQGKVIAIIDQFSDVSKNPFINLSAVFEYVLLPDKSYHKEEQFSYMITDSIDELNISDRQLECLFLLIRGKSAREIASILDISKRTVETHIETMKIKLNCTTQSHLIEKMIFQGGLNYIPQRLLKNGIDCNKSAAAPVKCC